MLNRCIHVIESVFVNQRCQALARSVVFPSFLGDNDAISFLDRVDEQVDIDGADTPEINDFCFNAFFSQVFSGLQGDVQHARVGNDGHMPALPPDFAAIEWYRVLNVFVRDLALDVVKQFMLDEEYWIGVAYCGFEHTLGIEHELLYNIKGEVPDE